MIKTYEEIEGQVKKVIDHSNDMDCKTERLMKDWKKAKGKFIEEFGGDLIIESPSIITVSKPDEDKILEFREYVDDISFITRNEELRVFLQTQGWTAFYNNRVRETWDKYGIKVSAGMKMTRALKLFILDKTELDKWQSKYSRIIQDVKIHGRLCLSVHPLDFLSISETTHNWRSCHSLDGEYRSGNLSYMLDEVTVVAYLKSEGQHKLRGFGPDVPWNSKKWRMLLYVNTDRDMIFSSKPYPFDNKALVSDAYALLEQTLKNTKWPLDYETMNPDEAMGYMQDHPESVQFNDCLCSITFDPRFKCANDKKAQDCKRITVGAPAYCLECEEEVIEFGEDYSCVECGDYITCESCGCHLYTDEAYELDDQTICPGCYDDSVVWCDRCGESHNRENPELVYNEAEDTWCCPDCYDDMMEEKAEEEMASDFE